MKAKVDKYDRAGNPLDLFQWAQLMRDAKYKRVARTELPHGVEVSTVWLGLDHSWGAQGPPMIFETMIFGGKHDGYQIRYSTEEEAMRGHVSIVSSLEKGLDP